MEQELIIDVLKTIGHEKEAESFVKIFKEYRYNFAVIKISGKNLETDLNMLAMDLAFLSKIGLSPIVVHGSGSQTDSKLNKTNNPSKKIDGMRITTKEQLPIIHSLMTDINISLTNKINFYGGKATSLSENNIFECKNHTPIKGVDLGLVGEVISVNKKPIIECIKKGIMPILAPKGYSRAGEEFNVNADSAANAVVSAFKPKKFIFVTSEGGIRNKAKEIISNIELETDLKEMEDNGELTGGMLLKAKEIYELLKNIEYDIAVQITSPENMLKELFTVKGCGTYVRLSNKILEFGGFKKIDKQRLKELIENGFGKALSNSYFEEPAKTILIERDYKGAAIIKRYKEMSYLDKFVVKKECQGEGIGKSMWTIIEKKHKKLFWRAKLKNPINPFYFQNADGMQKFPEWIVFWKNLNESEIREAVNYSLSRKSNFIEHM